MSEISKITIDGVEYSMKDAEAREELNSKADKSELEAYATKEELAAYEIPEDVVREEDLEAYATKEELENRTVVESGKKVVTGDTVFYVDDVSPVEHTTTLTALKEFTPDRDYVYVSQGGNLYTKGDLEGVGTVWIDVDALPPGKYIITANVYTIDSPTFEDGVFGHKFVFHFENFVRTWHGADLTRVTWLINTIDEELTIQNIGFSKVNPFDPNDSVTIYSNIRIYAATECSYSEDGVIEIPSQSPTMCIVPDRGMGYTHTFEYRGADYKKRYLSDVVEELGDIETALDAIIAIQNELIGGESI